MLESSSKRLCEKGGPHYGSPDKIPEKRLETIMLAGIEKIPFTSGILIGIGETRLERIEALLALRKLHEQYGHLQEIIIQNFRAKADTRMFNALEPSLEDLIWTIAAARIIFGPKMNLQAPPNLSPGNLEALINAGINDWGGISPLTPDHVNPEAPWPELQELTKATAECAGRFDVKKLLTERLAIYPDYAVNGEKWLDETIRPQVLRLSDSEGLARINSWSPGMGIILPEITKYRSIITKSGISKEIEKLLTRAKTNPEWSENDIERLLCARGVDFEAVCVAADDLRKKVNGDVVTYAVNRNINYTNICTFHCGFCSFSKGKMSDNLRGKPYNLNMVEIIRRTKEAWERGATEVCLQGGIHPNYTGQTYLDICKEIKTAVPGIHIHAFSPLEVWQGAKTLRLTVAKFLYQLRDAGLDTLPGTAAEVLDDEIRKIICPDKLTTEQWLSVMRDAHDQEFRT
ncbi:MAG: 7,8-didemethyl-8-hydroxy-5-deazariboflavin synthase CofG, partial [Nitrospinaceae bacterium]